MLVAEWNGTRAEAAHAAKGNHHICPQCRMPVTLRQGSIKIAHFAHRPPTNCTWAKGETKEHRQAKIVLCDGFRRLGYQAEYEVEVLSAGSDRRADVLIGSPATGERWAVEVQHSPLLYPAIQERTEAYIAADLPVVWMGILSQQMKIDGKLTATGFVIEQYSIRPWEKWAQAFAYGELWYVDADDATLWCGTFSEHRLHVPHTSWYESGGVEQSAGGYSRRSKRWRTLTLRGPFNFSGFKLFTRWRKAWSSSAFTLPAGKIAGIGF